MELTLESDADALWQDAIDLLEEDGAAPSLLAMLRQCTPTSLEEGTLRVETPMRLVVKTLGKNSAQIEECLATAAFEPVRLEVVFSKAATAPSVPSSSMTREEAAGWDAASKRSEAPHTAPAPAPRSLAEDTWDEAQAEARQRRQGTLRRESNPLVEDISENDSKLTFDRFVVDEENNIAYQAAIAVAEGINKSDNPLFIYGKSGLGKAHLLRAIQNYIAKNDPGRVCVYKDASSFINDYTSAMSHQEMSAKEVLRQNYVDIDVLLIDDIQKLAGKVRTVDFFFDTFNALISAGKQIVLAADRSPAELGMGKNGFDERVTSRINSGFSISVQVPSYELKLRLVKTFCKRMREDAEAEHVASLTGTVPEEICKYMAERAGTNIRVIEGFCQRCLFIETRREQQGTTISRDDVDQVADETWAKREEKIPIEQIQKAVEKYYDISHADLIGDKRNKTYMVPRHVAIWLCRDLCDATLEEIGKHFGGRSHATIKHSISVVDNARKEDKLFFDQVVHLKEMITENH